MSEFPNPDTNIKLEAPFDIKQQLETLKVPDWENIPPFHFYFRPLKDASDKTIKTLLDMFAKGPLLCKYNIPKNTELQANLIDMVEKDNIVQWLAATHLL